MGTEVTSFFEGAAPSIHLRVTEATTVQEVDRVFSPIPPPKRWKRGAETIPEEGTIASTEIVYAETVYVWKTLPVMHILPELKEFYPSVIVNQLMGLGIVPPATGLAKHSLPLAGRLQHFKSNWARITQDPWVLEAIQGYRVPFSWQPYQTCPPRALTHPQAEEALLQQEIGSMLEKHAIEETAPSGHGFLSTVFLVPKKDGGQRPVINLKSLNKFVYTEHFKMEGIHILRDLLRAGDWMTKVDLKDAYFMVPIHEEDRAFLKFSFKERTYQFKCLPFGLACAPWVFTKVLKPLAAQLRQLGMRLMVYIDNILILAESKELAQEHVVGLIYLLENLGFVINKPKSILELTQSIEFLRFSVNSVQQELSLPAGKVKKIRAETWHLLEGNQITTKKLSQLLGRLQAATRAVPLAPLFYHKIQRALQRTLEQSDQDYSAQLILSTGE